MYSYVLFNLLITVPSYFFFFFFFGFWMKIPFFFFFFGRGAGSFEGIWGSTPFDESNSCPWVCGYSFEAADMPLRQGLSHAWSLLLSLLNEHYQKKKKVCHI